MKKLIPTLFLLIFILLTGCSGKNTTEYKSEVQNVADKILENSAEVEKILDQYSSVWDFSIKSNGAILVEEMAVKTGLDLATVKKYFTINAAGNIPNDFSLNVFALKSYFEDSGELNKLKETADEIKETISKLNDPPKGFEKVYDELLDMYTYAEEFLEMALNPSGSLKEFNENKNQLSSDILSQYKRVEATMPNVD